MNGLSKLLVAGCFVFASTLSMAADTPSNTETTTTSTSTVAKTSMANNWTCTTNASSSDVAGDKAADDKMANTKSSASDAFAMASKHCRDCTKITCEQDND